MPGTTPAVERVILRFPRFLIFGWFRHRIALRVASKFRSGSPMPMRTRLSTGPPASRSPNRNCPAISPEERSRTKPLRPVAQKGHPRAQPTWVEAQSVRRPDPPRRTVSIRSPSRSRRRNFRVASIRERRSRRTSGPAKTNRLASSGLSSLERSVIPAGSETPRPHSQRQT
jgi:hypothetical protein